MCRILLTVSLVLVCASGKSSAATLVDRTAEAGIVFRHHANPTPTKYLIETMGAGVAYNEDGRSFAGMGVDFEDYDNDARRLLPSLDHAQGWTKRTSGLLYSIRGPAAPLPAESSETIRNS